MSKFRIGDRVTLIPGEELGDPEMWCASPPRKGRIPATVLGVGEDHAHQPRGPEKVYLVLLDDPIGWGRGMRLRWMSERFMERRDYG